MLTFFIILYLFATVAVGLYASRKVQGAEDYALAGRSLPLHLSLSAFFATWFGAETILGASAQFAEYGFTGIIEDPLGASICLILTGAIFVKHLYPKGYLSIGDFFKERYGTRIEFMASIIQAFSYFTYTAAQFVAIGLVLQTVTGIPFLHCLLFGTLLVVIYTYWGGMWAVAITDFFQTIVIIIGLAVLAIFLLAKLPTDVALVDLLPANNSFLPENTFKGWGSFLTAWMVLGFGSIPSQDVFQRIMSAKSEKVARKAAIGSGFLYLTVAFFPIFIVMLCLKLFGMGRGGDYQQIIPSMVLQHMPLPVQTLFFGALISAILSTASASLLAQATVVGENLVKPYLTNLSEKKFLYLLRIMVLLGSSISIIIALEFKSIFQLTTSSSSIILVSLFVPLTLGLYMHKAGEVSAWLSMILGIGILIYGQCVGMDLMAVFWGFIASLIGFLLGFIVKKRIHSTP